MYRQTDDNEIVIELNEVVDNSTNTVPIFQNRNSMNVYYKDIDTILEKFGEFTVIGVYRGDFFCVLFFTDFFF